MARKNNIVKFRHGFSLNIGFIVFFVIIIYVIFHIFTYITSKPVSEYEVRQGTIATNNVYKGLILRSETIIYAQQDGYINYFVANDSKVGVGNPVFSVDTDGSVSDQIQAVNENGSNITPEMISETISSINNFTSSYSENDFSKVYSFKNKINSTLIQSMNQNALNTLADAISTAESNSTFYMYNAADSGIVHFGTDGYEEVTPDNFTIDQFNNSNYEQKVFNSSEKIGQLDPAFKMITSENWDILINISDTLAQDLNEKNYVTIRFCDDDYTTNAGFSIIKKDGQYFIDLKMKNSLIRYIDERFTNIELVLDSQSGLKIPNSAITKKEFFTIPKKYFTEGKDSSSPCLMKKASDKDNSISVITPTIFFSTDDYYYIDDEDVSKGDTIVLSDSSETYTIGTDTDELTGVYNINKGYAVFKQINILSQNDDYTIVETGTTYGVALYDHIALDGSSIVENQTITK